MPIVAGGLADKFGLSYPMLIVGVVSLLSAVVGIFLRETSPRRRPGVQTAIADPV